MGTNERTRSANRRTAISAHRGGSEDASPGTWEAYKSAVENGVDYVEFDIRRTKDDELVVYHDEHANHTGPALTTISYEQLCARTGYEVPKVGEVMKLSAGKVLGHLDLKEIGYEDAVISLAIEVLGAENFVATSLEDVSIARIKREFPQVRTALSLGRDMEGRPWWRAAKVRGSELFPMKRIRDCGTDWVAVNHKLATLTVLGLCAKHGIGAMVWTVNDDELIATLLADSRVDVLITDRPRRAVGIRDGES